MITKTPIVALLLIAIGTGGCGNKPERPELTQTKTQAGDAKEVYGQIPDSARLKDPRNAKEVYDQIPDSPRLK